MLSRFFETGIRKSSKLARTFLTTASTTQSLCDIERISLPNGSKIIQISAPRQGFTAELFIEELKKRNNGCIVSITTPTALLDAPNSYTLGLSPGHNSIGVVDGSEIHYLSKRPNTNKCLQNGLLRVADERLVGYPQHFRKYETNFSDISDDIDRWTHQNLQKQTSKLLIMISAPNHPMAEQIIENIKHIKMQKEPYTLFNYFHRDFQRIIPANNCNSAFTEAIFGVGNISHQDRSCQGAARLSMKEVMLSPGVQVQSGVMNSSNHGIEILYDKDEKLSEKKLQNISDLYEKACDVLGFGIGDQPPADTDFSSLCVG